MPTVVSACQDKRKIRVCFVLIQIAMSYEGIVLVVVVLVFIACFVLIQIAMSYEGFVLVLVVLVFIAFKYLLEI
jgi:hypothetical protein